MPTARSPWRSTVARRFGEPLVLVYGAAPPGGIEGEEFRAHLEALEELGRRAVAHAVERATAEGVTTEVAVVREKPAEALVTVADERDATMIVVGSYGETPLRGALLGSTPHRLLAPFVASGARRARVTPRSARPRVNKREESSERPRG